MNKASGVFGTGFLIASLFFGTAAPLVAFAAAANLVLTAPETAAITQSTLVDETSGVPSSNAAVEAAVSGLTPIAVRLQNTGAADSANVRISPIGAGAHIQLWAKDTSNNWYDINVTGWIDTAGIAVPATYDASTDVYAISDAAGSYPLTVNLVDAATPSTVVARAGVTLTVSAPVSTPTVTSVSSIADINVANGTTLDAAVLPTTAAVVLSDNTTPSYTVTWDGGSPTYDGNTAGTYTFTGTLTVPGGVINTDSKTATVKIVVAASVSGGSGESQTATPAIITPIYTGATSVSGTSENNASILLSINGGVAQTATADASGNWTVTGLTLATGDAISVTAQGSGETVSAATTATVVAPSVTLVDNLQPSWGASGGGGVWAAYQGATNDYVDVTPGATAEYLSHEAAPIYAGLAPVDPTYGDYEDEGYMSFKFNADPSGPGESIVTFAAQPFSYDFVNQYGTNPVWVYMRLNKGQSDEVVYQYVPVSNPSNWHKEDVASGGANWVKWNDMAGDTTGNPKLTLAQVADANPTKTVDRITLVLGMGNSYHVGPNGTDGTVAWVDTVTIGDTTYDFVVAHAATLSSATITSNSSSIGDFNGATLATTDSGSCNGTNGNSTACRTLNVSGVTTANGDLSADNAGFKMQATDGQKTALTAYFAAQSGWTDAMETQIASEIAGDAPFFYFVSDGSGTYSLADGFKWGLGATNQPLVIDDNYPAGAYTFTGTIAGVSKTVTLTVTKLSNVSALTTAKNAAQTLITANAAEGTVPGQHIVDSLATLIAANTAANATDADAQSVVDGQVSTLNDAITAYNVAIVPALDITVTAENFNTNKSDAYYGATVGYALGGADAAKVASVSVALYDASDNLLVTNTSKSADKVNTAKQYSSAFRVKIGTYTESSTWNLGDTSWTPSADVIPAKAVITVTDVNGFTYTAENTSFQASGPSEPTWVSLFASDISALTTAKATAQGLITANAAESTTPGEHVVGSLATLTSADTAANATDASSQSVVDSQVSTLDAAISAYNDAIVPPSTMTAYNAALAAKVEADYTTPTWNAYQTIVTANVVTEQDSQTAVNTATDNITTAQADLVFAGAADLTSATTAANSKPEADYTPASWTTFSGALTTALALPETTNTEVVAKTSALTDAMAGLVLKANKTTLTSDINAEYSDGAARTTLNLAEADYTGASWTSYAGAISSAVGVEADANATQSAVNDAATAIGTTKAATVFAGKADLDTAKGTAASKSEADYTATSWTALTSALALSETTNAEIVSKTTAVNGGVSGLVTAVAADKIALTDGSVKGANADLANIIVALANPLPSTGANGSTITWASNNTSVVSNDGQTVVRPAFVAGDATVTLTATMTKGAVSDTKVFTLTVLKLTETQTVPNAVTGAVIVDSTTPEVVITNPTQAVTVTVDSATTNPTINFDALVTGGTGTLPETTINSTVGSVAVEVVIPNNAVVTSSDPSWDGNMLLPQSDTGSTSNPPAGFSVGDVKIEVGSPDFTLSFDQAVSITLTGVTGTVGYRPAGSTAWQTIDTQCNSATNHDNINAVSPKECYFHDGGNTIIWTYHFTSFGGMNPIPAPVVSSGGGGGPVGLVGTTNGSAGAGAAVIPTVPTGTGTGSTGGEVLGASAYQFSVNLTMGSTGNDVTELQKVLIAEGDLSIGAPTGVFGPLTKAAVIKYQMAHKISPQSGYVGLMTRGVLGQGSEPTTPEVLGASAYNFATNLSVGSNGADVTALQNLLTTTGNYTGPVTGYFGALTKAAVQKYQTSHNVSAVGNVGPMTRAALNKGI